ncbi:thiol-activated cytolysin family protein [uncultured Algoriphagus sp.]|uniref:thiol-activated cytolysin family protein n=1 Tax=uncultured Algoriphagus sp. TaxID=417365 RepID=UPI0030EE3A32|tara:strand:- start:9846 stop:11342 length:1497 start_codon:yes stop_codon:yes gene_type:complete
MTIKFTKTIILCCFIAIIFSCKEDGDISPIQSSKIQQFDNSKNPFNSMEIVPQNIEELIKKKSTQVFRSENSRSNCTSTTLVETRGIENLTLLEGTDGIIYPGSLFNAQSVISGKYQTITGVTKRPMTLTFTLEGLQGNPNKTIVPTNPNYFKAYTEILNTPINGTQPANISYSVESIKSEEQLKIAVAANFKLSSLADISAEFNFNSQNNKTRIIAKFIQSYFTVDVAIPEDGIYIEEYPNKEKFGTYSPMYISSLNYGRLAMFFMESSYSEQDTKLALEATIKFVVKGSGSVSLEQKNILNSSKMRVLIKGGSGSDGVKSVSGYDEFVNYIKQGGEMTNSSRGEIISYSLRNLSNHTNSVISFSAKYNDYDCVTTAYKDGEFLRDNSTEKIYQVFKGKIRHIPHFPMLQKVYSFHSSMLIHLSSSEINSIPIGNMFASDLDLIRHASSGIIYLKEGNTLRRILDENAFNKYRFNWNGTTTVSNISQYNLLDDPLKF